MWMFCQMIQLHRPFQSDSEWRRDKQISNWIQLNPFECIVVHSSIILSWLLRYRNKATTWTKHNALAKDTFTWSSAVHFWLIVVRSFKTLSLTANNNSNKPSLTPLVFLSRSLGNDDVKQYNARPCNVDGSIVDLLRSSSAFTLSLTNHSHNPIYYSPPTSSSTSHSTAQ